MKICDLRAIILCNCMIFIFPFRLIMQSWKYLIKVFAVMLSTSWEYSKRRFCLHSPPIIGKEDNWKRRTFCQPQFGTNFQADFLCCVMNWKFEKIQKILSFFFPVLVIRQHLGWNWGRSFFLLAIEWEFTINLDVKTEFLVCFSLGIITIERDVV